VEYARQLLDQIGLGGERVQMFNLSSAQGAQFAQYCTEFADKIRAVGINLLRSSRPTKQLDESG
jgi:F420-non-reducing hydrogenase iron-sulfur subunit